MDPHINAPCSWDTSTNETGPWSGDYLVTALNMTSVKTEAHIPWILTARVQTVNGVVKSEGCFQRMLLLILFNNVSCSVASFQ